MSDPETPRSQDLASGATQHLPVGEPEDPHGTHKLERTDPGRSAGTVKIPPEGGSTLKVAMPPVPSWEGAASHQGPTKAAAEPASSKSSSGIGWKMPVFLGGVVAVGVLAYFAFSGWLMPGQKVATAKGSEPEAVPQAAKLYYDQAMAGDAHAMRMLGVMYYYGLNIPQDRVKGLYWYRKAAEKGSDAARDELRKLESGS